MKTFNIALLSMALSATCFAQSGKYTITGEMTRDSLRYKPEAVRTLYLNHVVNGREEIIDSAKVSNRTFRFEGVAPRHTEAAFISGFDNGNVQLLLEAGDIVVKPFDAHFPSGAQITGTTNNDIWNDFQLLVGKSGIDAGNKLNDYIASLPEDKREDHNAILPYQSVIYYGSSIYYKLDVLDHFLKNINSEAALFMVKYNLGFFFTPLITEKVLLAALPPHLAKHPLYADIRNGIKSKKLSVGNETPDFSGLTPEGKSISLSDLRGKYVFLDVWASWCGPCRREFPFIKQAMAASEAADNFVVLSYSIDSKKPDWVKCIEKNQLTHKNWIHISALKGWQSDVVNLFGIKGVPYTALINPEGKAVAFNLRGENMLNTAKNIVAGTYTEPVMAKEEAAFDLYAARGWKADKKLLSADDLKLLKEYRKLENPSQGDAKADLASVSARLRFLLDHPEWAVTPFMLEKEMLPLLDKEYDERLPKAVSHKLNEHPYLQSLKNEVLAQDLKTGGELPDIQLPKAYGKEAKLSDHRGKFVLLHFTANENEAAAKELANIDKIISETASQRNKIEIVKIALPSGSAAQKNSAEAEAMRLLNVKKAPKSILVDPEGYAISFVLKGEELNRRVKQILAGDLYYKGMEEKK